MMNDSRIWLLMSRLLSGETSQAEAEELQRLLMQSPEKQYLLDILHAYFTAPLPDALRRPLPETEAHQREQRFLRIIQQATPHVAAAEAAATEIIAAPVVRFPIRRIVGYAAAVLLSGVAMWLIWRTPRHTSPAARELLSKGGEVVSRAGARTKLVLPDGTQVWLNANSRLKYASGFNEGSREVELEGEACFDVVSDPQHPFIVHASTLNVRVLGTVFNIKSYPQDITVEATLLKGMIEVSRGDNKNAPRVILRPNEKLVFNKQLSSSDSTETTHGGNPARDRSLPLPPDISVNVLPQNVPDSNKEETAWMYNRLVFDGDSFRELAAKMERWYNVKIIFKDQRLANCRFGGVFANETIEEALSALQLTAHFTYKIRGNEIELYGK